MNCRSNGIIGIKYWDLSDFNNIDSPNVEDNLYEGMFSPESFNKRNFKFKAKYNFSK